ncbi:hypothetical protein DB32_008465 [Sandaracinus amylolyticus]|uniref:Outer membrane protein beta-barrel domain-containing protein n=1 Tax=Sandaracinus amylolyticus TaxID=927083 RepID=A0A0F6YPB4_9BACT|nr:hypothetical protein DB32_008465 [Sandaracinus amylolyticus]
MVPLLLATCLGAISIATLTPSSAAAQDDVSIGSTNPIRNWYAGGGLGVSAGLDNGGGALFLLNEEVGYQLDPILLGGGTDLQLRFGLDLAQHLGDFFILTFGARATASFGVWTNGELTIRVAPALVLGGAVSIVDEVCTVFGCAGGGTNGAFNIQFSTQAELDLLQGMLTVYFRPIAIDGYIADGSGARWNIVAGALVHF